MKKSIAIIGCGPSALLFASFIDTEKYDVVIYEKNAAPARKFLVAGDGGFNLTYSEPSIQFIQKYTPSHFLKKSIQHFSNNDLQNFLKKIGIETYIGSSKRIFPVKGIKPIDVLNAILNYIKSKKIELKTKHTWKGWNEKNELLIEHNNSYTNVTADYTIFSLGGASWNITGSDGKWFGLFNEKGIQTIPFQPSNCAYKVDWQPGFISKYEGFSLKNIELSCNNQSKKGELIITKFGLEGSPIYALSPQIRTLLNSGKKADIYIDLKSMLSPEEIEKRIFSSAGNKSLSKHLHDQLKLNKVEIDLIKHQLSKEEYLDLKMLSKSIKHLPIILTDFAPIDEAISTVGGIALSEVNENFELKNLSRNYILGEMLDWDAPTGGYLLQGCFSMGAFLANVFNTYT